MSADTSISWVPVRDAHWDQDVEDLMQQWRDSIDFFRMVQTEETAAKAMESFNAILEYMHAGEPPWDGPSGPDELLVKVTTAQPFDEESL